MIRIDTGSGTPIYRQVIDQVKLMVVTGQLPPDTQLESVSSLAARLKVNPMTISKAYSALVDEGVAQRRRGVGIFVAPADPRRAAAERNRVLSEALEEAAALVVRLQIDADTALELFGTHIAKFKAMHRSKKS